MTPASLSLLVAVQALPGIAMDIGMNYLAKMDMFLARERLGIYSWQALVTALLVVSMPVLFIGWNLLFFCFYWTVGLVGTRADGVLVWLCFMSSSVLNAGFGVLLGAVSPNRLSLPYILSLIWNCESMTLFRGLSRNRLRPTILHSAQCIVMGFGFLLWPSLAIPLFLQCTSFLFSITKLGTDQRIYHSGCLHFDTFTVLS